MGASVRRDMTHSAIEAHGGHADPGASRENCALAHRAQTGDSEAFAKLTGRYQRRVYNLTRNMVATDADAQELVQETFLSVFRALPQFKVPTQDRLLSAWIFRIAVNAALMHLRARRRRPVLHIEDMPRAGELSHTAVWPQAAVMRRPDDLALDGELKARLQAAMAALPDKYRLVLWLRDIEEQGNDEVAQTLGLTVPTVKARLHRARLAVRDALSVYLRQS